MHKLATFLLTCFTVSFAYAQTVKELYNENKYDELVKYEQKADALTGEELYMVGLAFYERQNDEKAIEFYDKAIAKGIEGGNVYFYKAISLCYMKKYDEAMKAVDISLEKEPENQLFMNQKGLIYRYQGNEDKALAFFEKATKMPNISGEPFFWIGYIYHGKQDFTKALKCYYVAADSISRNNYYYGETFKSIGQLEFSFTKNYAKSASAYVQAIEADPENYELYYKLMKSYNAAKQYTQADSVFAVVKAAFEQGKLPKEDMEIKTVAVAQFDWNGQSAVVRRSLVDPKESLDVSYKVFLLGKNGSGIERRFLVEKTIQFEKDGAKHLLCEQDKKTGDHLTYPYGWSTDAIPLEDLEKAVKLVLDGKMTYSAKSNFGNK
ncbi:MAG TPA: tetratricopeptide repeat protein [Saprospiraceae bacterium]|nr:tetratricopeptide repeat protein [Saprospiraceae bacterium]